VVRNDRHLHLLNTNHGRIGRQDRLVNSQMSSRRVQSTSIPKGKRYVWVYDTSPMYCSTLPFAKGRTHVLMCYFLDQ
jgi:hypothetical protein